jgi:hypothetical protein
MNHERVEYGRKHTQKGGDIRLHYVKSCILIALSISIIILGTPRAQAECNGLTGTLSSSTISQGTASVTLTGADTCESPGAELVVNLYPPSGPLRGQCANTVVWSADVATDASSNYKKVIPTSSLTPGTYCLDVFQFLPSTPPAVDVVDTLTVTAGPPPTLTINPSSGPPTTGVTLSGSNFAAADTSCVIYSSPTGLISNPKCAVSGGVVSGSFTVASGASGSYTVTVTGATGDSASASFTVTTSPPPPPTTTTCGVMLSVAPAEQSVVQGGTAVFELYATPTNPSCIPSSANLYFQIMGLGPGMNYEFGESTVSITTDVTTPPGVYAISLVDATGTTLAQMTVTVTQAATTTSTTVTSSVSTTTSSVSFDFSVTVTPSTQSVPLGGSASYVVSVLLLSGNPTSVSLTVVGLPSDIRSSFTLRSGTPPYTSMLNLDLSTSSASPGAYTLTVEATGAGGVKSASATLIIQPAQTTTSFSTTPTPPPPSDGGSLIAIIALVAVVAVLGVLLMRSRGRRTLTQQTAGPQQTTALRTFCGKCGAENPASNQFCISCGSKLKRS